MITTYEKEVLQEARSFLSPNLDFRNNLFNKSLNEFDLSMADMGNYAMTAAPYVAATVMPYVQSKKAAWLKDNIYSRVDNTVVGKGVDAVTHVADKAINATLGKAPEKADNTGEILTKIHAPLQKMVKYEVASQMGKQRMGSKGTTNNTVPTPSPTPAAPAASAPAAPAPVKPPTSTTVGPGK